MIWRALFFITIWLVFWLLLVQLELAGISPDGTYGSDARYYYEAMRMTVEAGRWWPPEDIANPGYVAFGTVVLRTSPTDSVVWVKLANIILLLTSLVLGFYILCSWGISKRIAYFVIILAGTNGTIIWMATRNLKDTLFLFLTLMVIFGVKFLLSKKHPISTLLRISGIVLLGFVSIPAMESIRPWGFYWTLSIVGATLIESIFERKLQSRLKILRLLLFIVLVFGLFLIVLFETYRVITKDLEVLFFFTKEAGGLVGATSLDIILAPARFLIGPGPIRAIFGHEVFWVTTTMGNILVTLGSIMWWTYLPVLVLALLQGPKYWLKHASVLIPLFIFLAVYSFVYSGSLETRFRAVVYFFSFLGTAAYLDMFIRHRKPKQSLAYAGIAFVVWVSGTITSYQSLIG